MQKKVCLLGASAVGKTSLVSRYIRGIFSERYLTTIGVKIDKKTVEVDAQAVDLLVWDLNGEDCFQRLSMNYLRGAAGYVLVADGTADDTLDKALTLYHRATGTHGAVPAVLLLNKHDLKEEWTLSAGQIEALEADGWTLFFTSAKTGENVDEAFAYLAAQTLHMN
ncbi:MAG: Rab family GTPase [Bacteroidota bacterium]